MTGPEQDATGRGHLRAGHADREHAIEVLKAAFAQGRLDQDELDTRVGQAFASRTYAELFALTADIPADPAAAGPAAAPGPPAAPGPRSARPSSTPARTLAKAARRAGLCILVALALVGLTALTNLEFFAVLAYYCGIGAVIAASGFLGYGVIDAWHERRSRAQPPPRPGRGTRELASGHTDSTGHDPPPPDMRADRTRADLRRHPAAPARGARLAMPGLGWAPAPP